MSEESQSPKSDAKPPAETPKVNSEAGEAEKKPPTIHLDQFLKTCGVATGGQAKVMIQTGEILVNDKIETRRRKQLTVGDEVTWQGVVYIVALNE